MTHGRPSLAAQLLTREWKATKLGNVLDCDPIEVLHKGRAARIRLTGIDCPEKGPSVRQARHHAAVNARPSILNSSARVNERGTAPRVRRIACYQVGGWLSIVVLLYMPSMSTKTRDVLIRNLPVKLANKVKIAAGLHGQSLQGYVQALLEKHVKALEKKGVTLGLPKRKG